MKGIFPQNADIFLMIHGFLSLKVSNNNSLVYVITLLFLFNDQKRKLLAERGKSNARGHLVCW